MHSSWLSIHPKGFTLPVLGGSDAGGLAGQKETSQLRTVISRQIVSSVRSQPLHWWGWARDLSPLLPVFLLLLFEWLRFHGISIFPGWLKINSEVKDEKRYNVQAFNLMGKAPEITYNDDLFWKKHSIFLQVECCSTLWMIVCQPLQLPCHVDSPSVFKQCLSPCTVSFLNIFILTIRMTLPNC